MRTLVTALLVRCVVSSTPTNVPASAAREEAISPDRRLTIDSLRSQYFTEAETLYDQFYAALEGVMSDASAYDERLDADERLRDLVGRWESDLNSAGIRRLEAYSLESNLVWMPDDIIQMGSLFNALFDSKSTLNEIWSAVSGVSEPLQSSAPLVVQIQAKIDWHTATVGIVERLRGRFFESKRIKVKSILNEAVKELEKLKYFITTGQNPSVQARLWRRYRDLVAERYETLRARLISDFPFHLIVSDVRPHTLDLENDNTINTLLEEWASDLQSQAGVEISTDALREQILHEITQYERYAKAYVLKRESSTKFYHASSIDQSTLHAAIQWHNEQIDRLSTSDLPTVRSCLANNLSQLNETLLRIKQSIANDREERFRTMMTTRQAQVEAALAADRFVSDLVIDGNTANEEVSIFFDEWRAEILSRTGEQVEVSSLLSTTMAYLREEFVVLSNIYGILKESHDFRGEPERAIELHLAAIENITNISGPSTVLRQRDRALVKLQRRREILLETPNGSRVRVTPSSANPASEGHRSGSSAETHEQGAHNLNQGNENHDLQNTVTNEVNRVGEGHSSPIPTVNGTGVNFHEESSTADVRGHASSSKSVRSAPNPIATSHTIKKKTGHGTKVPSISDSTSSSTASKMTPGVIVAIVVPCVIAAVAGLLFVMRGRIF